MAVSAGTRFGLYEIVAPLGAGGMGEVYRARDTRLGRSVAVKVLPDAFLADPERIARFEREAKVLAALNHPHIAVLHGMEAADGRHFLVMELVEGETLAERLQRGRLDVEDALRIALQIADALEAAHEQGIVHRDLKPANVKITPDEKVKVLDFGLAKAMETAPAAGNLTTSPTLSMMATQAGLILGTAAYMSPEQAKGFQADQRSDVFAFGSVLYEMLTGRQAFQGDTVSEVLASVLVREPDLAALPANLNPRLVELVKRCLEKNPKRRWQAIGDVRAELETIAAAPRAVPAPAQIVAPAKPLWRRAIPVVAAAVVTGMICGVGVWTLRPSMPPPIITRFPVILGEEQQFTGTGRTVVAISPDGAQVVYVANARLYLRSMSELDARPIPGTEAIQGGVTNPVFSPDGRSITFFAGAERALKRISASGGAAVTICAADNPFGMSWDKDAILVGQGNRGILRVSANGGKPEVIVHVKSDEAAHGPQMLPDGQTMLFTLATGSTSERWDKARIVVQSLKSGERKVLLEGGSDARYLSTGHIVYALGGVLFALPFDLERLAVTGGPVPVVEGVRRASIGGANTGTAQFSVSNTGSLAYVPGPASASSTSLMDLALVDRQGHVEPLKLPPGPFEFPRLSPDGKRIAFGTDDGKEAAVWIYELSGTGAPRRLTFGGRNRWPVWSADGQRVAFVSDREGDAAIFWQRADGTGAVERLTKPEQGSSHVPLAWSPKGDVLLFGVNKGTLSLWMLSFPDRKTMAFDSVQSSNPINPSFLAGRSMGRLHVGRERHRNGLRPTVSSDRRQVSSLEGGAVESSSPALVAERQGTFLHSRTESIRCHDHRDRADGDVQQSGAAAERIHRDRFYHGKDVRHHARRQAVPGRRAGGHTVRRGSQPADSDGAQLVRGAEAARAGALDRLRV